VLARPLRVRGVEPYLYLLPALLLTILWTYWPVLGTVQLAFYQWNLLPTTPRIWVGLENFEQLFRHDAVATLDACASSVDVCRYCWAAISTQSIQRTPLERVPTNRWAT
jgi:ABC-type sugar transport system permease subunit